MNHPENKRLDHRFESRITAMALDRLVDGEVSGSEYRELLAALEGEPDGWRRCALTFLEAQAWGRELRGIREETGTVAPEATASPHPSAWSWLRLGSLVVACAASFLLAFDIRLRLFPQRPASPAAGQLAGGLPSSSPLVGSPNVLVAGNQSVAGVETANKAQPFFPGSAPVPVGRYRFVVDGESSSPQSVEMPVFAADDPRAGWLLDDAATMPHELIRELEKSGHQVKRQRNWIPVPGNSGNPLYVPLDDLQITPVSSRIFQ